MKKIIFSAIVIVMSLLGFNAKAQINWAEMHNAGAGLSGSRYLPASLGESFNKVEIQLLRPYVNFNNTTFTMSDFLSLSGKSVLGDAEVTDLLNKLKESNRIYGSFEVSPFNVGINVRRRKHKDLPPIFSVGFSSRQVTQFNVSFNNDLFGMILQGNKPYAGKYVSLTPAIQFLNYSEYALAGAASFKIPSTKWTLRPAVRVRRLNGIASVNLNENAISLYTSPDGRQIKFGFNYDAQVCLPIDTAILNQAFNGFGDTSTTTANFNITPQQIFSSVFQRSGKGLGYDFGLKIAHGSNFSVEVGVIDLGKINFEKGSFVVSNHNAVVYEGYNASTTNAGQNSWVGQLDSFKKLLLPTIEYKPYSVALGGKLIAQATYKLGEAKRKDVVYYKHSISAAALYGFKSNYLISSKKATVSAAYMFNLKNIWQVGANVLYNGDDRLKYGFFTALQFSKFKIGINSNDVLPLVSGAMGQGFDIGLYTALSF